MHIIFGKVRAITSSSIRNLFPRTSSACAEKFAPNTILTTFSKRGNRAQKKQEHRDIRKRSLVVQGCDHLRAARALVPGQERGWHRGFRRIDRKAGLPAGAWNHH